MSHPESSAPVYTDHQFVKNFTSELHLPDGYADSLRDNSHEYFGSLIASQSEYPAQARANELDPAAEILPSVEQMALILLSFERINQERERLGLPPRPVTPQMVHLFPPEIWHKTDALGFTNPTGTVICARAESDPVSFFSVITHELIHANTFRSLDNYLTQFSPATISQQLRRYGHIAARYPHSPDEIARHDSHVTQDDQYLTLNFTLLNEVLTEHLNNRFVNEQLNTNSLFATHKKMNDDFRAAHPDATFSNIAYSSVFRPEHLRYMSDEPLFSDHTYMGLFPNPKYNPDNPTGENGEYSSIGGAYLPAQVAFDRIVDYLAKNSENLYKNDVYNLFIRNLFTGHLLSEARLFRRVFGTIEPYLELATFNAFDYDKIIALEQKWCHPDSPPISHYSDLVDPLKQILSAS